jgi:hypothetical protein
MYETWLTACALMCIASCGNPTAATATTDGPRSDGDPDSTVAAHDGAIDSATDVGNIADAFALPDAFVAAPANDRCANAQPIDLSTMHVDVPATTSGASADLTGSCMAAGKPDVFFKFTLTRRQMVYADTFGATSNTALYFASSCTTALAATTTAGDAVCNDDACGTTQSQVAALLDPGTYYLVLAGDGAATIHVQHAEVGTGTVSNLAQGTTVSTGITSGTGDLYQCDAGGPENAYWWRTCPTTPAGTFSGSTCVGTSFDTIVSLQVPSTESVICDDDTCSFQSTVSAALPAGAGLYVVAVDGFSAAKHGAYKLTATRP